jgi:hypothetical protein
MLRKISGGPKGALSAGICNSPPGDYVWRILNKDESVRLYRLEHREGDFDKTIRCVYHTVAIEYDDILGKRSNPISKFGKH